MKNPITIKGLTFNMFFKHYNENQDSYDYNLVETALDIAEDLGQISREYIAPDGNSIILMPEDIKGYTICFLEDENRKEYGRGYSFCFSTDNFEKKEGRRRSKSRAIRDLVKRP